jgi:hypothetical protein
MGTLSTVVAESHLSPTERAWSDESGEGKEMYYCSCIKERMKGRMEEPMPDTRQLIPYGNAKRRPFKNWA